MGNNVAAISRFIPGKYNSYSFGAAVAAYNAALIVA